MPAAAREMRERHPQHQQLLFARFRELLRAQPPANFRMPRQRACTRTRSVHQNPVEIAAKWKRLRGVEFNQLRAAETEPLELGLHRPQAVRVVIRCDYKARASRRANQRGGLASGRRA